MCSPNQWDAARATAAIDQKVAAVLIPAAARLANASILSLLNEGLWREAISATRDLQTVEGNEFALAADSFMAFLPGNRMLEEISATEDDVLNTEALEDVIRERVEQVEREGFSIEHDDAHPPGDLAMAAACYAAHTAVGMALNGPKNSWPIDQLAAGERYVRDMWPWERAWWKPKEARRNLVRAAALLIAEIERMDRAAAANDRDRGAGSPRHAA